MKYFDILLHSRKTVFGYSDLALLLATSDRNLIKSFIQRAVKQHLIYKVENGLYTLEHYDILELSASIRTQSYISLETVLQKSGIIFQDYSNTITLVSDNSLEKHIAGKEIRFSKIKNSILLNPIGIHYTGQYMIASPERAICDLIYLSPDSYLDHPTSVDLVKLRDISMIYPKSTQDRIQKIIKHATNP